MSTHSTFSLLHLDGKVSSIYIHWNGHIQFNGLMLFQHYKDIDKIKDTIHLGDISELRKEINIPNGVSHNFDHPAENITIFYTRDRHEKNCNKQTFSSLKEFIAMITESYNYLFNEQEHQWYFFNEKGQSTDLKTMLLNSPDVRDKSKSEILLEQAQKLAEKMDEDLTNKKTHKNKLKV